jgi:hypothetical protein
MPDAPLACKPVRRGNPQQGSIVDPSFLRIVKTQVRRAIECSEFFSFAAENE